MPGLFPADLFEVSAARSGPMGAADQLVLIDQALDRLVAAATGRSDRTAGRCGPDAS